MSRKLKRNKRNTISSTCRNFGKSPAASGFGGDFRGFDGAGLALTFGEQGGETGAGLALSLGDPGGETGAEPTSQLGDAWRHILGGDSEKGSSTE